MWTKTEMAILVLAAGLGGAAQAGDMGGAVAYSLGEFDRVGVNQPAPRLQQGGAGKKTARGATQTAQNRELDAQKAEFVRRMFWVALSMR